MKKRLVCALLVMILVPFAAADLFDWGLYVQGGDFDQAKYIGQYQSGSQTVVDPLPADAFIYHFGYQYGHRGGCSGSGSGSVESGVFADGSGQASVDFNYVAASAVSVYLHGSDDKASGFSNFFKGTSCHYTLYWNYNYAVRFYVESSFVNRRNQERDYGELSQYIPAGKQLGAGQVFAAHSQNPGVMMWFGTPDSTNVTSTTDETQHVYACEDTDQNLVCDYIQDQDCRIDGGAWYGGRCCGVDKDTPTCKVYDDFVQMDFAGNIVKNISFSKPALCGVNVDGEPEWAYVQDVGNIHELVQCPNLNVMSDGKDYYQCGVDTSSSQARTLGAKDFTSLDIIIGSKTHQFNCVNNKITECKGDDLAMSDLNVAALGEVIETVNGPAYCSDSGVASTDLDGQPIACANAQDVSGSGFEKWTGHYCCSEDLDTGDHPEAYNDPYDPDAFADVAESSAGGCFESQWVPVGTFLVDKKIINAQGVFYGCQAGSLPQASVDDTHVGGRLVQSMNACDKVDLGELAPDHRYAVCQPWGEIDLVDDASSAIEKAIQWNVTAAASAHPKGCCPSDQCWNGFACQSKGSYYRVGGSGFACN